jgi:membrane protease YdiL (CAAX protease family)
MSTFIQQADAGRSSWALLIVGMLVVLGGGLFLGGAGTFLFLEMLGAEPSGEWTPEGMGISTPAFVVMRFIPHLAALALLAACVRGMHDREFRTLVTGASDVDVARLGFGLGVWAAVMAGLLGVAVTVWPERFELAFEPAAFVAAFVPLVLLVPVQAATEELVVRGYLMQELGSLLGSGWAAVILTALFFGVLHLGTPELQSLGLVATMPFYVGYGLLLGAVTLLDDRLELAIGIHTATNLFTFTTVTYPNATLPVPAIWRLDALDPALLLAGFAVPAVVFLPLAAAWYGWRNGEDV